MSSLNIIIRAYNSEKYIGEALQSVLENLYALKEEVAGEILVCYDRKSHDNTYSILKEFSLKYPELIHVIEHEHMSAPEALIYCLKRAQGAYLFLLDYDDLYPKDHIRKTIFILRDYPKGFGFTKIYFIDDVTRRIIRTSKIPKNPINIHSILKINYIGTSSICIRNECVRELLNSIDKLPKSIIPFVREDWLIALLAFKECTPVFISDSYVFYRLHVGHRSATGSTDSLRWTYDYLRDIITLLAFAKLERSKLSTSEWKALEQGLLLRFHNIAKSIGKDFSSLLLFTIYFRFIGLLNIIKRLIKGKETDYIL